MDHRIIGAQLNSALYLAFVAWAGITTGHQVAAYVAIAAMGVTYLTYLYQLSAAPSTTFGNLYVWLSVALGIAAGILLLA